MTAACVKVDVTKLEDMHAAARKTIDAFGKVHVICNNAGVGCGGRSETAKMRNWQWVVDVNLWGVVNGLQAFVPLIQSHGEGGHVVSTASVAGMISIPGTGPYNATKYAVVGIMETMMAEQKDSNLGISVLCPGLVATNLGTSARNRQEQYGGAAKPNPKDAIAGSLSDGLDPDIVGPPGAGGDTGKPALYFHQPRARLHDGKPLQEHRGGPRLGGEEQGAGGREAIGETAGVMTGHCGM